MGEPLEEVAFLPLNNQEAYGIMWPAILSRTYCHCYVTDTGLDAHGAPRGITQPRGLPTDSQHPSWRDTGPENRLTCPEWSAVLGGASGVGCKVRQVFGDTHASPGVGRKSHHAKIPLGQHGERTSPLGGMALGRSWT